MSRGGAREGAGRKSVRDETLAKNLCLAAIKTKYGSIEQGLVHLLESKDPALKKFVFEHAIGKPTDKIDLGDNPLYNIYKFELPKNGRELAEDAIKHTNGNGNGHHS